ncbi:MAG TPA: hypothetical protein VFG06_10985 [Thermodesulfovibrionales bacterium]|nr:hypothetical protein [Thermodesulfovibrionales bacterium]
MKKVKIKARQGRARRGLARRGMARPGKARVPMVHKKEKKL